MLWFPSIFLGCILGSLTYNAGLGNKRWEDVMWGAVDGFLFTLVCYAILFFIFGK